MTIASDIRAAAESLTHLNWRKGRYFSSKGTLVCMCAHGAMQAQSSSTVKRILSGEILAEGILDPEDVITASHLATTAMAGEAACEGINDARHVQRTASYANSLVSSTTATAAAETAESSCRRWAAITVWEHRPSWVRGRTVESSYLLGAVGLTASFNDAVYTTLEMVKEKFEQAAELADLLGV